MTKQTFNIRRDKHLLGTVSLASKTDQNTTASRLRRYVAARFGQCVSVHPVLNP